MVGQKRKAGDAELLAPTGKKAKTSAPAQTGMHASTTSNEASTGSPTNSAPAIPQQTETPMEAEGPAVEDSEKSKGKRKVSAANTTNDGTTKMAKYRKLAPPRPFPTVPTSVSATGPRSAHVEGKNYICITRKTPLGAYLRRCKDAVLKAGHKTLHLNAMGAAIPHLLQLSLSLPEILPYSPDEIHTEVLTGTVDVQDEVIPDDEDEDISLRTRGKSTLSIVIKIGDGKDEGAHTAKGKRKPRNTNDSFARRGSRQQPKQGSSKSQVTANDAPDRIVVRAEEMED